MSSRFKFPKILIFKSAAVVGVMLVAGTISCLAQPLLVCADPQNAPFSDRQKTGFENRIAEVIGADLHRPVRFYWARKGRGFVREVVNKGSCDVLIDIPLGVHGLLDQPAAVSFDICLRDQAQLPGHHFAGRSKSPQDEDRGTDSG